MDEDDRRYYFRNRLGCGLILLLSFVVLTVAAIINGKTEGFRDPWILIILASLLISGILMTRHASRLRGSVSTVFEGIQTIEKYIRGDLLITDWESWHNAVVDKLKSGGAEGSKALAKLIKELLKCRSPKLDTVIWVAAEMEPTPELIKAVTNVTTAKGLAPIPEKLSYPPEIHGAGTVAWTDGTEKTIKNQARDTLAKLHV